VDRIVDSPAFEMDEFAGESLFIRGAGGKLGQDLGKLSVACGLNVVTEAEDASYVALCTPSHVAEELIGEGAYQDKTVIDLSGAAKRRGGGQYGLMKNEAKPWDKRLDVDGRLYGNPGCIASAVILGLGAAGLEGCFLPRSISVVSVGGRTHAPSVEAGDIKLARRMNDHPHVSEIERAFGGKLSVDSFMPVIADVPEGLLVNISGRMSTLSPLRKGEDSLSVQDVTGTHFLRHRLEYSKDLRSSDSMGEFSLGVVIDNVRFVTANVIKLIRYLKHERSERW
jgi:N-acetyl-gamma-glutamylphosphate reductase